MPTPKRPRGASFTTALRALAFLAEPRSTVELGRLLGVSDATAKRLVSGIRAAGYEVESVRDGREVRHRITRGP